MLKRIFIYCFFSVLILLFASTSAYAQMHSNESSNGQLYKRSLESLRDLDYQTWQVVAYQEEPSSPMILRIVGYPGSLRLDHPTVLEIHSGIKDWRLKDITLANPKLARDPREAAAEFDLQPLLKDLKNNRPLRLKLTKVFSDLPVPPYVVSEWRSLFLEDSSHEIS